MPIVSRLPRLLIESTRDSLDSFQLPARVMTGGGLSMPRCGLGEPCEAISDVLPVRKLESILTGDEDRKDLVFSALKLNGRFRRILV